MDIRKAMEDLLSLKDKSFALYQVDADPIQRKIPAENIPFIIEESMKCGQKEAEKLLDRYYKGSYDSNFDIYRLARKLGIQIKEEAGENILNYICFGMFEEPATIILFTNHIKNGEELVQNHDIKGLWGINLKEIVLAHEIFHYIEAKNRDLFVNQYRIKLWKLGPYTHTSTLVCASEIAGMAFAKSLLNLNFCPTVLDVLLLYPYNINSAVDIYKRIMKFSELVLNN